jgi:hypothetical protein
MPTEIVVVPEKIAQLAALVLGDEADFTERYFGCVGVYAWIASKEFDYETSTQVAKNLLNNSTLSNIAYAELEKCIYFALNDNRNAEAKEAFLRAVVIMQSKEITGSISTTEVDLVWVSVDEGEVNELLANFEEGNNGYIPFSNSDMTLLEFKLLMRFYSDESYAIAAERFSSDVVDSARRSIGTLALPQRVVDALWK